MQFIPPWAGTETRTVASLQKPLILLQSTRRLGKADPSDIVRDYNNRLYLDMHSTSYPSLQSLRQLAQVGRSNGIAAAARKLNISQPALSKAIRRLEQQVGVDLIDRHRRGAELTRAGKSFLKHAERAVLEYEHAVQEARKTAGIGDRDLRIGAGVVFSSTLISRAVPLLQEVAPNVRVSVRTIAFEDIEDELEARRIDIAVHGIPQNPGEKLVTKPLFESQRSIICDVAHPLASAKRPVSLNEIGAFPFVSFSADILQMRNLDRVFYSKGLAPPTISAETDTVSGALKILRHGQHLLFGSSLLVGLDAEPGLVVLPTEHDLGAYSLGVVHLDSYRMESAGKSLVSIIGRILNRARAKNQ